METERIASSQPERDRLRVLHEVQQKQITQIAAARRLAARLELKILRRVRQRYADFGPTLAAEHLAQEGLRVSRETLRKWMVKTSLWCPRAQRVKTIHVWRERRASFGELVMQDSSPFRWHEKPKSATSFTAASRFCPMQPETDSGFNQRV